MKISFTLFFAVLLLCNNEVLFAQTKGSTFYQNPILHADYSDPDVIRVGDDYYMIASSFNCVPGLPILHSKDLVHWTLRGYALNKLTYADGFDQPQHGNGVWAPSIRYHKNEFYIYFPDPDHGIYLIKAKNIDGPWTEPVLVEAGKGLIDPCPLWDDNGKNYLVHAYAGSRAGFKSILVIKELNAAGDKTTSDAVLIYDGHDKDATVEGPKIHKRNKYYYIFAPAGGVSTGWQIVLRSKNIYGPYERRVVMAQGSSIVNGPHQGAWVQTAAGGDWFLHFQDKEAYGRIVHLQPMQWKNGWPVIGEDKDGDGTGDPVMKYKMPAGSAAASLSGIPDTDECNGARPGLQWQWHANPQEGWLFPYPGKGVLRMNAVQDSAINLWQLPNLLMQKLPAEKFTATAKFVFTPKTIGERFGLVIMGSSYAYLSLVNKKDGLYLSHAVCNNADKRKMEEEQLLTAVPSGNMYFKVTVDTGAVCSFSYSADGDNYTLVDQKFTATPGRWIGAKIGFFCRRPLKTNDAGFTDIDWFRIEK
jgi:beta-xylosidase